MFALVGQTDSHTTPDDTHVAPIAVDLDDINIGDRIGSTRADKSRLKLGASLATAGRS